MNQKQLRKKYKMMIEKFEERAYPASNWFAEAVNIKIYKDKIVADVKLINDLDQKYERYNGVEYKRSVLDGKSK